MNFVIEKIMALLSRKYLVVQSGIAFLGLVPVFHKAYQVSDHVSLAAIGGIVTLGGAYGYFNVKDAKVDAERGSGEDGEASE